MGENRVDIEAGLARKLRLIAVGVAMPQDRDARKALFDKAASAVDELRAAREENGRLRRALEDVVRDGQGRSGGSVYMVHKDKFLAARAALKGTP